MEIIEQKKSQSSIQQIEYLNSFGAIFSDGILIHQYNPKIPIHIKSIKKVALSKRRVLHHNYFFLLLAIILIGIYFFLEIEQIIYLIVLSLLILGNIFLTFFIKKHNYKFIVVKSDNSVEKIDITSHSLEDAKQIFRLSKKKMKHQ